MIIPLWHLRLNLTALLLSFSLFVVFLVFVSGFWLFTLFLFHSNFMIHGISIHGFSGSHSISNF